LLDVLSNDLITYHTVSKCMMLAWGLIIILMGACLNFSCAIANVSKWFSASRVVIV